MSDVLSQSEVESLLAALDPTSQKSPANLGRAANPRHAQVTVYDFKRPERVSKEQMRAFQAMHEGFSREFGAALSGMLRSIVEVKLISVDQLTYSEFVFSLENPTCFTLLHAGGLDGNVILDLNPSIIFPIVDRLLGGGKESRQAHPSRPLTEIELRLVSRITKLAITGLEKAWGNLCDLQLKVMQVESNPQLIQIVPPNEVIVLISFELTMGETRGILNLCIPYNTIEPLAGKLSSDTWSSYSKRSMDPRQKLSLESGLARAKVRLSVQLARTVVSAGEIASLSVGDLIMTGRAIDQGPEIAIEGRPLFSGKAGLVKGQKAVEVGRRLDRPQDALEKLLAEIDTGAAPTERRAARS
jgi:flagellar motor switch protein FliM